MNDPNRRQFLQTASIAADALLAGAAQSADKVEGGFSMPLISAAAFVPVYQPKSLSFDPSKLNGCLKNWSIPNGRTTTADL